MDNFNLKKFLVENKLTTSSRTVNENTEIEEIRRYFEILIDNQPKDAVDLIMRLIEGGPETYGKWLSDIKYDIVDTHGGDYDGDIEGYDL